MKKFVKWGLIGTGGLLAACIAGTVGIGTAMEQAASESPPAAVSATSSPEGGWGADAAPSASAKPSPSPVASVKPTPAVKAPTVAQVNAVGSAEAYLATQAFSRTGLIKQLKFEGYSTADATYAVDHITVNWTEQADRSAKQYMEMMHFSRSGLISQLKFEGFTTAQATHGATSVGL